MLPPDLGLAPSGPPPDGRAGARPSDLASAVGTHATRSVPRPVSPSLARVRVTLLLADAAQASEGKLYILGGGWSITGPAPTPSAIAIKIDVPWDQTNRRHEWQLRLHDADGEPVRLPGQTPDAEGVAIAGEFEVGRPPGLPVGSSIDFPLALPVPPLPLPTGQRFEWRLSIDGEHQEDWTLSFATRRSTSSKGPTG